MTHAGSSAGEIGCEARPSGSSEDGGTSVHSSTEHRIDNPKVRRFESPPAYQFRWAEELKCETGVYVRRWYWETPLGSIRLHHWLHSDDARAFHDHPWWFVTLVLWGGYRDVTPTGEQKMRMGSMAFRPANHRHTVQVNKGGCWTVLVTGPKSRKWGFWIGDRWKRANKYFFEHGRHVCD